MNLHVVPMKAPDQGMNGYFQPLLFCVTSSRLRGYGFSLHDGVMNLDFLGAEQNFTVLEGSQPTYRLDFMDDSGNSLVLDNVTFDGLLTAPDGTERALDITQAESGNTLMVVFPVVDVLSLIHISEPTRRS